MSSIDTTRAMGRREFLAFGTGVVVAGGLGTSIHQRIRHGIVVRRTMPVMGTIAEVVVVHPEPARANAAIDAAMAELQWVERTMTRFTPTSDIGRANLMAARDAVVVTPETALVVAEGLRWAESTDGSYDPAVGRVVAAWDVNHRHEPPPAELLTGLAGERLYRFVEVGTRAAGHVSVLRFHDPRVQIDLGSIAKGYAIDRAVASLRRFGIEKAVVDVGGDLYALGTGADGQPWRIGIRDPNDARALAGMLDVSNAAIGTSGSYMQYFQYHGTRYHHLMDPDLAAPRRTRVLSTTVKADLCIHADVAATSLYGKDAGWAARVLARRAPGASIESVLV
jgi:FAD:protein FMN transferase